VHVKSRLKAKKQKGYITAAILDQQERRDQLQQEASEMAAVAAIIGSDQ